MLLSQVMDKSYTHQLSFVSRYRFGIFSLKGLAEHKVNCGSQCCDRNADVEGDLDLKEI
jgi:hypothetical protein